MWVTLVASKLLHSELIYYAPSLKILRSSRSRGWHLWVLIYVYYLLHQEKEGPPVKRYLDLVDILLTAKDEMGQGLSAADIRAEVDTFLFAGIHALRFSLPHLSQNFRKPGEPS